MQFECKPINGISIIIPNYNGVDLLPEIIPPALAAAQNTSLSFEIIVVDDHSSDESVNLLKKQFPFVTCIENNSNLGFSKTVNKGIYASTFNWILLLNSDVILEPGYLKQVLKYTSNNKIFGVTGRIIGWNDDGIMDAAKFPIMHGTKLKTSTDYMMTNAEDMQSGIYSLYLTGANAFINKEALLYVGGLNELFSPFYAEDTELSIRAWRLGFECMYEHNAICRHQRSSTINSSVKKEFIRVVYNRNKMYLHAIHLQGFGLWLWWAQLVAEVAAQTLLFKTSYIKSFVQVIRHLPQVKESRKAILQKNVPLISLKDVVKKIEAFSKVKSFTTFVR